MRKRLREEAAWYCGVLACTPNAWAWSYNTDCGVSFETFKLWWVVMSHVRDARGGDGDYREWSAEAEALLRTGWSPE